LLSAHQRLYKAGQEVSERRLSSAAYFALFSITVLKSENVLTFGGDNYIINSIL
jgi:hypothetical protein